MLKIQPKRIGKKSGGEVDRKQKDYAWNRWKMGEKNLKEIRKTIVLIQLIIDCFKETIGDQERT